MREKPAEAAPGRTTIRSATADSERRRHLLSMMMNEDAGVASAVTAALADAISALHGGRALRTSCDAAAGRIWNSGCLLQCLQVRGFRHARSSSSLCDRRKEAGERDLADQRARCQRVEVRRPGGDYQGGALASAARRQGRGPRPGPGPSRRRGTPRGLRAPSILAPMRTATRRDICAEAYSILTRQKDRPYLEAERRNRLAECRGRESSICSGRAVERGRRSCCWSS